jgi:hypothetical protein
MGLLDKRNRRATRKSVTLSACLTGIGSLLLAVIMLIRTDIPIAGWLFILPFMGVLGAVIGATIEWQVPRDH